MPVRDLVADVARKSAVLWLDDGTRTWAVWHVWATDAICVLGDGVEQPLPDVRAGERLGVLLRSKSNRALVARAETVVEELFPEHVDFDEVVAALKAARLNLRSPGVEAWGRASRVLRLRTETVVRAADLDAPRHLTFPSLTG